MNIKYTKKESRWFNNYKLPQQGLLRIFAFPYSGAGATAYYHWAQLFKNSPIDFIGVQPPGRENRLEEIPYSNLSLLVEDLLPAIRPLLDKPFIFFGHSLGALIAFELCRALQCENLPLPQHLFISAFRSPEHPAPEPKLHGLSDKGVIDGLRCYGGTPKAILDNPELLALFLPLLRADFSLHETYSYQQEPPLSCPITALSGIDDNIVSSKKMRNWQQQTSHDFRLIHYAGNHFFLHEQHENIVNRLKQVMYGITKK